jgi:hypothetical protein
VLIVSKQSLYVFLGVFEVFHNQVALDLELLGRLNRVFLKLQLVMLHG